MNNEIQIQDTFPERPLTDAELIALAAVANCDATEVLAANMHRAALDQAMAYEGCASKACEALERELKRRGVL